MSNKIKIFMGTFLMMLGSVAYAGTPAMTRSVPTLSEVGLIALAFAVGIIGASLIRKLKTSRV